MKSCPICEAKDTQILAKDVYLQNSLYICNSCKFEWLDINQAELTEFYNKEYFTGENDYTAFEAVGFEDPLSSAKKQVLEQIKSIRPNIKQILEIGPSTSGGMIKYFLNSDAELSAVEVSEYGTEFLNSKGLNTFCGDIQDYSTDKKFDLIITTEVIEHTSDPKAFLKKIHSLLSPEGVLLVSTGNTNSLVKKIQGRKWRYYEFPVHLSYFSDSNLMNTLRSTGFDVLHSENIGFSWKDKLINNKLHFLNSFASSIKASTGMYFVAGVNNPTNGIKEQ